MSNFMRFGDAVIDMERLSHALVDENGRIKLHMVEGNAVTFAHKSSVAFAKWADRLPGIGTVPPRLPDTTGPKV